MDIHFKQATLLEKDIIFGWLNKPHVQEFWDNSPAHREDILNFMNSRKEPSTYADGIFTYWVGSLENEPYCLLMTSEATAEDDLPEECSSLNSFCHDQFPNLLQDLKYQVFHFHQL